MTVVTGKLPTKGEFSSHLDTIFRAHPDDGPVFDARLVNIETAVSNEVQENFSLMFRAPGDAPPVQSIYRLEHDTLGAMDLFLVPVKKDADALYYEAVFNQLI